MPSLISACSSCAGLAWRAAVGGGPAWLCAVAHRGAKHAPANGDERMTGRARPRTQKARVDALFRCFAVCPASVSRRSRRGSVVSSSVDAFSLGECVCYKGGGQRAGPHSVRQAINRQSERRKQRQPSTITPAHHQNPHSPHKLPQPWPIPCPLLVNCLANFPLPWWCLSDSSWALPSPLFGPVSTCDHPQPFPPSLSIRQQRAPLSL